MMCENQTTLQGLLRHILDMDTTASWAAHRHSTHVVFRDVDYDLRKFAASLSVSLLCPALVSPFPLLPFSSSNPKPPLSGLVRGRGRLRERKSEREGKERKTWDW